MAVWTIRALAVVGLAWLVWAAWSRRTREALLVTTWPEALRASLAMPAWAFGVLASTCFLVLPTSDRLIPPPVAFVILAGLSVLIFLFRGGGILLFTYLTRKSLSVHKAFAQRAGLSFEAVPLAFRDPLSGVKIERRGLVTWPDGQWLAVVVDSKATGSGRLGSHALACWAPAPIGAVRASVSAALLREAMDSCRDIAPEGYEQTSSVSIRGDQLRAMADTVPKDVNRLAAFADFVAAVRQVLSERPSRTTRRD